MPNLDQLLKPWFEKYQHIFEEEKHLLEDRGFGLDQDMLANQKIVRFSGQSATDPARRLYVDFPDEYPSFPPVILDDDARPLLRRHHRPRERTFCLFGGTGGEWTTKSRAIDAIDRGEELIQKFDADRLSPVPGDEAPEPVSALHHYVDQAAVMIPPPIDELLPTDRSRPTLGRFVLHFREQNNGSQGTRHVRRTQGKGMIVSAELEANKISAADEFTSPFKKFPRVGGRILYLPTTPGPLVDRASLKVHLDLFPTERFFRGRDAWLALVYPEESGKRTNHRWSWTVVHLFKDGSFHAVRTFSLSDGDRRARIPGLERLASKRVAILGCGCLGSKIAANLAATGVEEFLLVDPDLMEPSNSVRHEGGVFEFGVPKVVAVRERVYHLNPRAARKTKIFQAALGGNLRSPERAEFLKWLGQADLVINATGLRTVAHFLNEFCHDAGVPHMHVSVTNGAWGGEIVKVVPGKTPCWLCWQEDYEHKRPSQEPEKSDGQFAPGCVHPTFTGTTYRAGIVAGLAADQAVEQLMSSPDNTTLMEKPYLKIDMRDIGGFPKYSVEAMPVLGRNEACSLGCT